MDSQLVNVLGLSAEDLSNYGVSPEDVLPEHLEAIAELIRSNGYLMELYWNIVENAVQSGTIIPYSLITNYQKGTIVTVPSGKYFQGEQHKKVQPKPTTVIENDTIGVIAECDEFSDEVVVLLQNGKTARANTNSLKPVYEAGMPPLGTVVIALAGSSKEGYKYEIATIAYDSSGLNIQYRFNQGESKKLFWTSDHIQVVPIEYAYLWVMAYEWDAKYGVGMVTFEDNPQPFIDYRYVDSFKAILA